MTEPSLSPCASPVVLVLKPNGSLRRCVDYRKVNTVTLAHSYPLLCMYDVIDDLGTAKYVSKLDFLQGYYQISLMERGKTVSALVTPEGLYQFCKLPFGLMNGPSSFQRLINHLTAGMEDVRYYLDDLVVFSRTREEHLVRLRRLFETLDAANLTVNLTKSEFGQA